MLLHAAQNTGTSLLETFDSQAIEVHVRTTYEQAQASKVPAQMPINPGDDCKVCGLTKLTFEPPCIYCTTCGQRIKRGQTYHCTPMEPGSEFRGFWCHGCLQEQKGDRVAWEGNQVRLGVCWCSLGECLICLAAAVLPAAVRCFFCQIAVCAARRNRNDGQLWLVTSSCTLLHHRRVSEYAAAGRMPMCVVGSCVCKRACTPADCACCVAPAVLCLLQMGFVFKKDLQKKKNDDEVEEGWVACDCCDNWVHMICGLFNKGRNDQNVHYLCPYCLQQVRSRPVHSLEPHTCRLLGASSAACWAWVDTGTCCLWEAVASCLSKHDTGMSADTSTLFAAAALCVRCRMLCCACAGSADGHA